MWVDVSVWPAESVTNRSATEPISRRDTPPNQILTHCWAPNGRFLGYVNKLLRGSYRLDVWLSFSANSNPGSNERQRLFPLLVRI